jgi:site-specific DNA-methyltransferase (adenine-specific)
MNDIFNENIPLKTVIPTFVKHVLPVAPLSEVYFEDCVTAMKRYADNYFDLAIVDPPYDFSISKTVFVAKGQHNKNQFQRHGGVKDKGGFVIGKNAKSDLQYAPTKEYFEQLFRVSKNQIIFGGNYFTQHLPPSMAWIYWDKQNGDSYFSDGELAWTSFGCGLRSVRKSSVQPSRIHPTQKPIYLYDWILNKYIPNAFSGRKVVCKKILDTHLGSGSSRIAAYKGGFNFVGFEINKEYYDKQEKRFNDFKLQLRLF